METWLKTVFEYLYFTIGSIGVAIIVWGVIYRLTKLEYSRVKSKSIYRERETVRHLFATYLLMALEFLIAAAFNQLRQYADRNPSVIMRLMKAMNTLNAFARSKNQKELVFQHAEMIMNAAEKTFSEKCDLEDIKERFKVFKERGIRSE